MRGGKTSDYGKRMLSKLGQIISHNTMLLKANG